MLTRSTPVLNGSCVSGEGAGTGCCRAGSDAAVSRTARSMGYVIRMKLLPNACGTDRPDILAIAEKGVTLAIERGGPRQRPLDKCS
jgi:hypothetical protein